MDLCNSFENHIVSLAYVNEYIIGCYKLIKIIFLYIIKIRVVLNFFWRMYLCPTARLNGMMYGNKIYTCQLSRMTCSCSNKKNSRNHNLCRKLFL